MDFGARIYDPRIGRWLAVDPLFAKFPSLSSYSSSNNSPIYYIDFQGKEIVVHYFVNGNSETIVLKKVEDIELLNGVKSDNDFVKNMHLTITYLVNNEIPILEKNGKSTNIVYESITRKETVHVSERFDLKTEYGDGYPENTSHDVNAYEKLIITDNTTITYDPHGAIEIGKMKQSPAVGFLHDLLHFKNQMDNPEAYRARRYVPDWDWFDGEEEYTIQQITKMLSKYNRMQSDNSKMEGYRTKGYWEFEIYQAKNPDTTEKKE